MAPDPEPDTIRILVATDNHVGYEERDPIRKDDSWKTFDEIMNLARKEDVDMVLLGGDLFHDNKPSRKAMFQVMRSLRQNCLGMKPCELQFLSDANEVFEGAFPHVNYEDPDINISIPVFSIHGNHDDPTGDGHFCSLDLLQVAGLVNYFGRVPEADNIQVRPVLLQKGKTKLALYGLSNVRDERMHRTFRDNHVKWFAPGRQKTDWFNLLTVHQNHHAHTPTSYLPENMLPDWMDLVVWGHEHECLIEPQQNPTTGFHVMQPGSSVATSLVPGEAVPKHVAVVSITGKDFQVNKIPLKTVRPFMTRELVLATDKRFKKLAGLKDNRIKITEQLMAVVQEMIEEANSEWLSIQDPAEDAREAPLPLIRLKVEYTAPPEGGQFDCENPQRFSNRFSGKVANTNDVVYFYRKKTATSRKSKTDTSLPEGLEEVLSMETVKMEALVQEFLQAEALKILPQAPFGHAVELFVTKNDNSAMDDFVRDTLANQLSNILALNDDTDDLDAAMDLIRRKLEKQFAAGELKQARKTRYKPRPNDWDSDLEGHWEDQPQAIANSEPADVNARTKRGSALASAEGGDGDDDVDMDDVGEDSRAPKQRGATAKKATVTAKAAPKKTAAAAKKPPARTSRSKKNIVPVDDSDEEMFFNDEEDEPVAKHPPKRAQPARETTSRTRQTTINFSQSQKPTQKALEISDDEISEDDAFEVVPPARSRRR